MTWPVRRLEELAVPDTGAIKIGPFGSQLKREELVDDGIHVIGIENVLACKFDGLGQRFVTNEKYHALRSVEVRPGDVVITMMGTVGEVAVVPPGTSTSIMDSHLLRFRPDVEICLPEFVAWFLRSPSARAAVNNRAHGAIMKGLNSGIVRSLPVPLPPLSEQRRIVEILDQADRLRRLRAEADAKADRILPALFIKMFGDPLELLLHHAARPLHHYAVEIQNGFACGDKDVPEGIPHLRMNNIADTGRLDLALVRTVPAEVDKERYRLQPGDVLFMSTNSEDKIGKTCVFTPPDARTYLFSNHLIRVRCVGSELSPEYLATFLHLLWRSGFYPAIARRWVNQATVSRDALGAVRVPAFEQDRQRQFAGACRDLEKHVVAVRASADRLSQLFAQLLQDAFSGSLTAPWREAHMQELLKEMEHQARLPEARRA